MAVRTETIVECVAWREHAHEGNDCAYIFCAQHVFSAGHAALPFGNDTEQFFVADLALVSRGTQISWGSRQSRGHRPISATIDTMARNTERIVHVLSGVDLFPVNSRQPPEIV